MKWKQFSKCISQKKYSNKDSAKGSIAQLVIHRGQVDNIKPIAHKWYPKGIKNGEWINGYRYVDMNHSYYGCDSLILSEASCCIILVLLDLQNNRRFATHISASSDMKPKNWLHVKFDFWQFFKKNKFNFSHTESYFFSNNLHKNCEGSFEQQNAMRLFLSALTGDQLHQLAASSYFIEGENGNVWNPHCTIRLNNNDNDSQQAMNISFAH